MQQKLFQQKLGNQDIIAFFEQAMNYCEDNGFGDEIQWARNIKFEDIDETEFVISFAWVVINSGMKNQVAEKIFEDWCKNGEKAINHEGKRRAIEFVSKNRYEIMKRLRETDDHLSVLEELDWIGKITKYHLARNIGLDYAKPDRHLVRIAKKYGFKDVQDLCKYLSTYSGERIGVVDVILWRYCNMTGEYTI